ncbi:MAG: response regulator transcription factor [Caulobacterales bacterium]
MAHVGASFEAETPEAASGSFYEGLAPLGASYLQTRVYRRPSARLTSTTHFAAGGVISRIAPQAWPGSGAFNYICFDCNPLLTAIREGRTRYRFSDFAPHDDPVFGQYWEALKEADIHDALCATSYGPEGVIASLHLGFSRQMFAPDEAFAIQMAGLVLTERLMSLAEPPPDARQKLTRREFDTLAFVAEGKTDWEISVILGVSEATARFHVDNARRKLGAVNRAQAVARMINLRLI